MYGHMNDILVENMAMFKAFAEGAELADVQTARAEDRAAMAEDSKAFWEEFWVRRRTLCGEADQALLGVHHCASLYRNDQ